MLARAMTGLVLAVSLVAIPPGDGQAAPPTCAQQAEALGAWLAELAALTRPDLPAYPRINWAEQPGQARWPQGLSGPLVELKLRRAVLNGEPLPDGLGKRSARLSAVRRRFETLNRLRRGAGKAPVAAPVLLLAVDADEPWEEVCKLTDAASQAGFERLGLLYAHPDPTGPARPGPASIDGELAELDDTRSPSRRTRLLASVLRRVLGRCPQLVSTFGALAALAPGERARALAEELPAALEGCACKVDRPALERLLWYMLYTPPLSALVAPLASPDEAEPLTLRVPARERWRKVLPVLRKALAADAARPLAFDLER